MSSNASQLICSFAVRPFDRRLEFFVLLPSIPPVGTYITRVTDGGRRHYVIEVVGIPVTDENVSLDRNVPPEACVSAVALIGREVEWPLFEPEP